MAAVRVERRVAFEVNDVHWLLDLVGYGLGVAVVPEVFSHKKTAARFVPIAEPAHLADRRGHRRRPPPWSRGQGATFPRRRQTESLRRRDE